MRTKTKEYRNGWSTFMDHENGYYLVLVRDARGDVHDKMRCDSYRGALSYWKSFNVIARNA